MYEGYEDSIKHNLKIPFSRTNRLHYIQIVNRSKRVEVKIFVIYLFGQFIILIKFQQEIGKILDWQLLVMINDQFYCNYRKWNDIV